MTDTFGNIYEAFANYHDKFEAAKDTFGGLPAVERTYRNFLWNNRDAIFARLGEMEKLEKENTRLNDYASTLEKSMASAEPAPKGKK